MDRKSCRTYSKKKISYFEVCKIIENATNYAPSACNHQMWHFILIDNPLIKSRVQSISGSNFHFKEAPWLILICTHLGWNHNKFAVIQSAAAASQMILYFADKVGISGCWNAGIGDTNLISKLLKINRNFLCIGAITLGYSGKLRGFEIKPPRRPINSIVSKNIFRRPEESIYPLLGNGNINYWEGENHKNKYSVHDPRKWSHKQISDLRSYAVFAKSPFSSTYISRRFHKEMDKEIICNSYVQEKLAHSKNKICQIMPYGGSHTQKFKDLNLKNITIGEYSMRNIKFIEKRLDMNKENKINSFLIDNQGLFKTSDKFDLIYALQVLEQVPNLDKFLKEIKKISNKNSIIVFSFRNLFSWYGIYFYFFESKQQVPNFGPHRPLLSALIIIKLLKYFKIKFSYGITPLPNQSGKKISNNFLKFICRLFIVVCELKE